MPIKRAIQGVYEYDLEILTYLIPLKRFVNLSLDIHDRYLLNFSMEQDLIFFFIYVCTTVMYVLNVGCFTSVTNLNLCIYRMQSVGIDSSRSYFAFTHCTYQPLVWTETVLIHILNNLSMRYFLLLQYFKC